VADLALDGALTLDPLLQAANVDQLDTARTLTGGGHALLQLLLWLIIGRNLDSFKADATLHASTIGCEGHSLEAVAVYHP
jgi:hypothetical protein